MLYDAEDELYGISQKLIFVYERGIWPKMLSPLENTVQWAPFNK
jgi:hypothetical protein